MLIFDLELGQVRLIALDPRQLVAQTGIFIAHVKQVDVVGDNRRTAFAEACEGGVNWTD